MWCTCERHVWYENGTTSSFPLMSEWCACGTLKQGNVSSLERLMAEIERLTSELTYERQRADDCKTAMGEALDALKEIIRVIDHEQPLGNGHCIREIARIALKE